MSLPYQKYKRDRAFSLETREWPSKSIEKAPVWCSVDLRDGNQALEEPMQVEEKLEFFKLLVSLGFKEIEIGYPASSRVEYDFVRELVKRDLIPDDVTVQVLVMCRKELIEKTIESLEGVKKCIVHIYNNTSKLQRDVVFHASKEETKKIATDGATWLKEAAKGFKGDIRYEYSPESFNATEPDFALEVCNAVTKILAPDPEHKLIINLPATVEQDTPNVYADQVEWMNKNLQDRENIVLSIHPHNDRGTGVATAELGIMAGAERVEGTLFGNGERTGNVDILILAYNMFSCGVDPKLELSNIDNIRHIYERLCKLPVPERYPYAGKLVFTAFSGSHQDAISKGLAKMRQSGGVWEVPYLSIDPRDIGREYESLVRINSQSGKGGVAYVLERYFGFKLPRAMHKEFADIVQSISEIEGEVEPDRIMEEFKKAYIDKKEPYHFRKLRTEDIPDSEENYHSLVELTYTDHGVEKTLTERGNGPIDAVKLALQQELGRQIRVIDYTEHALNSGSNAQAAAYMHVMDAQTGTTTFGVGVSSNITRASVRAMFSAINRLFAD
ncbi:MAG: 2-isopropylmalate synthase [Lachnospiraceae bacterium]|nr:2-isopropylmalate synthase [Lachnospiraceae bacterium]MBP5184164.1 2-isopropylmalate synthase [Lachnospiraceae bacterium]